MNKKNQVGDMTDIVSQIKSLLDVANVDYNDPSVKIKVNGQLVNVNDDKDCREAIELGLIRPADPKDHSVDLSEYEKSITDQFLDVINSDPAHQDKPDLIEDHADAKPSEYHKGYLDGYSDAFNIQNFDEDDAQGDTPERFSIYIENLNINLG